MPKSMIKKYLTWVFCYFVLLSPVCAFADSSYKELLIQKSRDLNLASDREWLGMVYYKENLLGNGYESIFDSQEFFLDKDGKTNPQAELEADIESFFDETPLDFKNVFDQKQTSQCAFKGRYEWLKKKLQFDAKKLPEQKCADFEEWYQEINPKNATLIFASSYLNNPASMFGHTFLLMNNNDGDKRTSIISQAISYSASTAETNGVVFAYKGIFGLYKGQFSILPYYKMVKKYNNFENRDLWEYDLNLSPQQIRTIMTGLWEISNNHASYYFFSENCAYLLLEMMQVVEPRISYTESWPLIVIPSDTVIAITKVPGLVKETRYRPSLASKINNLENQTDKTLHPLVKKIAQDKSLNKEEEDLISGLDTNSQKKLYDLAYEYLQYSYQKSKNRNRDQMAATSLKILKKRSQIKGQTKLEEVKEPNSNPSLAHNPKRIFVGYGHNSVRGDFAQLDLRPAYHDLLDEENGFLQGAQINVGDLSLRQFTESGNFKLNNFSLVDIKSYSPRSYFFNPLSWQLKVGAKDFYVTKNNFGNVAYANLGVGYSFDFPELSTSTTFLIDGVANYGNKLPNNFLGAVKPQINLISNISPKIKLGANISHSFFFENQDFDYTEFQVRQNYSVQRNLSFRIEYLKRIFDREGDEDEIGAGVNYYF
ncbi:MAG: hypothetical protein K0R25_43 [Rickettsiaceae bacterium]|jgi:hypothetical protein|nr:hypothetical protein [Rickettsiaceae bacterium]